MAGKKHELKVAWPLAPGFVKLNNDTGLLKIVAMIAMFCDHAGKMLFPQYRIMRIIGRLAFPIYAYCIAAGCVYTRNPLNYLKRVLLLALISQPLYAVSLAHTTSKMFSVSFAENPVSAALNFYFYSWTGKPSILAALALGIILIWALREKQLVVAFSMIIFCWLVRNKLDYGIKGIILMVLFYLFCNRVWLSFPVLLAYMVWWGMQGSGYTMFGISFGTQMFAVFALPLIYLNTNTGIRLPKWLFYSFYPLHLVAIYLLDKFVF